MGSDARTGPALWGRAVWALLLIPFWLMLWSAHVMWLDHSPIPVGDQWATVAEWQEGLKTGLLRNLFSQHNEHRILLPRLVFLADWRWFDARNALNLTVIGLTQLVGAAFFVATTRPRRADAVGLLGLAVSLAALVSLVQWQNLLWAFQVQFVGVYAAAAWALHLFCLACENDGIRPGAMAAAVALLAAATFNMANGVFAGVAMAVAALITRRPRGAVLVATVVTGALLALYLYDYHAVPIHSPPAFAAQHPGRFLAYVAVFVGSIWSPRSAAPAAFFGTAAAAATAGMALVLRRTAKFDAGRTALFGVAMFVWMSAALTSLGRLNFGVEYALQSRYTTPAAYFWAAQAVFWALTVRDSKRRLVRGILALVFAAGLVRLVDVQFAVDPDPMGRERVLLASSALMGRIEDKEALLALHPDPRMVGELAEFMRRSRMSIFADAPPPATGTVFTPSVAQSAGACRGAFDSLQPEQKSPGVLRARGWGWDVGAGRILKRVVIVDGSGRVVGVGYGGASRPDVSAAALEVRSSNAGWIASINAGAAGEVIAYGITRAGAACELGRKVWPD